MSYSSKITPLMFSGMSAYMQSQAMSMPTPPPSPDGGAVDAFAGVFAGNQPVPHVSQEGTTPPPLIASEDMLTNPRLWRRDHRRVASAESDKHLDLCTTYLDAYGSFISPYRYHPEKVETLNVFLTDGGRWGEMAREFEQALSWLEIRVKEYEVLEREYRRTEDPSKLETMEKLMLDDIAQRIKGLSKMPFHRMMLAHKIAGYLARQDLLKLLETLAAVDITSHAALEENRGGPRSIRLEMTYRQPEELRSHLDGWFMGATPADMVAIEVTVSSSQQAMRVKHAIEDAGIAIDRNVDSVDGDSGALMGKELTVVLPSDNRMPVNIRLESDDMADRVYPAASIEPASTVRIGRRDGTAVELTMSVQEIGAYRLWRYVTDDGRTASEFAVSQGRMARRFTDPAFERFGLVDRLEEMARQSKDPN